MKPSELPGTRSLYRLTNRALIKIRELWQYAGEDELPPDSLLQAQVEALRILHIEVPLSISVNSYTKSFSPAFFSIKSVFQLNRRLFATPFPHAKTADFSFKSATKMRAQMVYKLNDLTEKTLFN
jgi:hypothetical protein